MPTKAATNEIEAEIDRCLAETSAICREMKKADAEITRLEDSTSRKLDHIHANLRKQKEPHQAINRRNP